MDLNNNNNQNVEIFVELIKITEQIETTFEYLLPKAVELVNKSQCSTLSQPVKSDIQSLRFIMDDKFNTFKNLKKQFEYDLMDLCEHNWIVDYIDKSNYETRKIIYCDKCRLTKRE